MMRTLLVWKHASKRSPLRLQPVFIPGTTFSTSSKFSSAAAVVEPAALTSATLEERFVGKTGAEILHQQLVDHKVTTVFGYPGGAILPVFDAIHESPHFKFILPRHEQGGGHMAEGYARATGKPGVLIVTSGPGATNTITPLMDALMDGTPLLVFSGQVVTSALGTDAFQEADVIGISRHCTKWNILVDDLRMLPRRVNEAFNIATTGRPGPVLIDLPKDVTASVLKEVVDSQPRVAIRMKQKSELIRAVHDSQLSSLSHSNHSQYTRLASLISKAKKPVIYAGQGIIQSQGFENKSGVEILKLFAETCQIPVTTTLQGLGGFDELSPLSLGMLGMHGCATANFAMQHSDLILALGARFDDRVTGNLAKFAPEAKLAESQNRGGIIHFEISPKNLHKVVYPTMSFLGDVSEHIAKLLKYVESESKPERAQWFERISQWKQKYPYRYEPAKVSGAIKPQRVLEELNKYILKKPDGFIITTGVGQHQMWAAQFLTFRTPRSMITSGGAGTMGFGLPAAIGAKLGRPDKTVVDIDGDASFSMTAMELMTAVEFGVKVKVLILNNNFQGMVKQWQDLFYQERYSGTKMKNPDFKLLAESMGAKGLKLEKDADIEKIMKEFVEYDDGPIVLDCICEKDEHVYPMVPGGKALHEMVLG